MNYLSAFQQLVSEELCKARKKHPQPLNSHHEAYAVILEELDELWDEIKQQDRNPARILSELIQVAAMCERVAMDVVCHVPRVDLQELSARKSHSLIDLDTE